MSNDSLPRVCIIGAGSSGIAAAKQLHDNQIPFDCFEKADRIGGLWSFGHNAGHHAAYRSLHINTSRDIMEFSDFPMPRSYPDYPSHYEIAAYFDEYVNHFQFHDRIKLDTAVEHAHRRDDDGVWEIQLSTGELREYDALIVANGHHWDPRLPEPPFPGSFHGLQLHSHDYIDNDDFRGKNVVVVGMGNSAMDIAVETSAVAKNVFLSARRGVHVVPKYALGKPFDHLEPKIPLPWSLKQRILQLLLRVSVGKPEDYGLPKPDHKVGEAHPTVSSDILLKVGSGFVKPRPNIEALRGDEVLFTDGTVETVDAIIYCTGYKVSFPFFDERFIAAPDNDLPLYKRVFKPGLDNAFFVGLLQPLGAIMPLAEAQSKLICSYLKGKYALPSTGKMETRIAQEREKMFKRYVSSKRHTMQVDFREYLAGLRVEARRGSLRANVRGGRRPVKTIARVRRDPVPTLVRNAQSESSGSQSSPSTLTSA